jgi:V/A-type H+-transporting ATPase subunit E
MKHLDTGSDKIKKICDAIRYETLEPAKQQAKLIIEQATDQAAAIVQEARIQAETILDNAKKMHDKERAIFESSMVHSAKIFKEKLKLEIEEHFLSSAIGELSLNLFKKDELCAKLVSAFIEGLKNKSLNGDLTLILSEGINKEEFVKALSSNIKNIISSVQVQSISPGVSIRSEKDNLRIDLSQQQLTQAILDAIRSDFRKYFFEGN